MSTKCKYLDVSKREEDYKEILSEAFRTEIGVRAIGLIYHDHSDDQNSYKNVFRLKDNIEYRLFSATHQYLVFLRELDIAENFLQKLRKGNPQFVQSFPFGNPYFERVERELSSIFDSIVFHLSSVFDYLSHALCYMYFTNKEKTLYWTKLAKKVRNDFKSKYEFCQVLDDIDKEFVGRLYDYRSRLLHNRRDRHQFGGYYNPSSSIFRLRITCSEAALGHFRPVLNNRESDEQKITLTYLSSWLIRRVFSDIERLLEAVKLDLESNSNFYVNLATPKNDNSLNLVSMNYRTNSVEPMSKVIWHEYKKKGNG